MPATRRSVALVAVIFAVAAIGAKLLPRPALESAPMSVALSPLPAMLGDLAAKTPDIADEANDTVRSWLPAQAQIHIRTYRDTVTGYPAQITRLAGTDREGLHDPRSCLILVGWRLSDEATVIGRDGSSIHIGHMERDGYPSYLVAYAYVLDGESIVADTTAIRARLVWQALTGGPAKNIVFWRVMVPMPTDANDETARRERLKDFVSEVVAFGKR